MHQNGAPTIIEGERRESRAADGIERIVRQEAVIERTDSDRAACADQRPSAKAIIENLVCRTVAPIHGNGPNPDAQGRIADYGGETEEACFSRIERMTDAAAYGSRHPETKAASALPEV